MSASFDNLTNEAKADLLWTEGVLLMTVHFLGYDMSLYSLGGDLIELFFDSINDRIELIEKVNAHSLEKFLARIKIEL